jgi:hypothetical protein
MASRRGLARHPARVVAASLVLAILAACSTTTSPDQRPSQAQIRVTGSSPGPLRLIVSLDFFETFDPVEQIREQVFVTADTTMIDALPYSGSVTLSALSRIVVDVSNPDEEPATVRVVVELDGNQPPYDQEATMSLGGALRYVYNWVAPAL